MSTRSGQSNEEPPPGIKVKVMVDKARNRVIYAEADHEFIDMLISFLTLPLGTVLRILDKDMAQMGSIGQIFNSAQATDLKFFRTNLCKSIFLSPRNASELQCDKLKLNVDPSTAAGKLFKCYYCSKSEGPYAFFRGTQCCLCGGPMDSSQPIILEDDKSYAAESVDGVFLKGGAGNFMITDDLQIMPGSTAALIGLFGKLGVSDGNKIEAMIIQVGKKEVLQLLKFALLSRTPLTNMVLYSSGNWLKDTTKFENNPKAKLDKKATSQNLNSMSLKLLVSKSKKKVLYAEAGVELVDLLFSFLVFPLGAVGKLLGNNTGLGCIDNLYKGVEDLSSQFYIKSEEYKNRLLSPKLFPHSCYNMHILQVEEDCPKYSIDDFGFIRLISNAIKSEGSSINSKDKARESVVPLDPFSLAGEAVTWEGYLKGPATFMIMDNLLVTPFSPISCIALLNQMKVSTSDVEERTVSVGKDEALNLLKASLISKTVLNDVFNRREPYPEVMLKV